jgi:hypothetical protein
LTLCNERCFGCCFGCPNFAPAKRGFYIHTYITCMYVCYFAPAKRGFYIHTYITCMYVCYFAPAKHGFWWLFWLSMFWLSPLELVERSVACKSKVVKRRRGRDPSISESGDPQAWLVKAKWSKGDKVVKRAKWSKGDVEGESRTVIPHATSIQMLSAV